MTFELPSIPEGMQWEIVAYSAGVKKNAGAGMKAEGSVEIMPRSLMLLIGHKSKKKRRRTNGREN
ncbi:MAG: hypothetical protein K6A72_05665 [Lachnospiraceae bacterium]|nr:hypothetical protein [Lachnospiraceae bacterium]